jgi:hypothetical protein
MLLKCSRFWRDEESHNSQDDHRNDFLFVIAIPQVAGLQFAGRRRSNPAICGIVIPQIAGLLSGLLAMTKKVSFSVFSNFVV